MEIMKNPSSINLIPSFLAAVVLFSFAIIIPTTTSANHDTATLLLLECLNQNSYPNNTVPISLVTYTAKNNTSYSSVLQSYIRNLRFNESTTPKPRVIVTPTHVSHIQAAIFCSKRHGMQMKIRSGGHDYEGLSYVSLLPHDSANFIVLDMFNLREINVNIEDETAWVQVGATLGEVYYRIAEKSNVHGFPAGVCPTVGVGGHFSGGGYGNMIRKYGLTVDNIIDAQIIDVNGQMLNRSSMGEDIFWAITGGGGASFGVVLAYKIKLVRVPPKVTVFRVEINNNQNQNASSIAQRWQQVAPYLHEDIFIRMILTVVNETGSDNRHEKTIRITFMALFLGDTTRLLSLMNQSFPELGLQQKDCTEMRWIESTLFWNEFPEGTAIEALLSRVPIARDYSKNKSDYLNKPMPKAGIEALFKKMIELETPFIQFNPYGGKMREISPYAKPFPHRRNLIKLQYITVWEKSGVETANYYINLCRSLYAFMTPYATKLPRDSFLNYRDLDLGMNHYGRNSYLEGAVYGLKYFKGNFNRLVQIKTKVDPENFFRNEQGIPVFPSWRK